MGVLDMRDLNCLRIVQVFPAPPGLVVRWHDSIGSTPTEEPVVGMALVEEVNERYPGRATAGRQFVEPMVSFGQFAGLIAELTAEGTHSCNRPAWTLGYAEI